MSVGMNPGRNPVHGRHRWYGCVVAVLACSVTAPAVRAQGMEPHEVAILPAVEVPGQASALAPYLDPQQTYSATRVEGSALQRLGSPAQTNTWTALKMAPSVNFQSADAYGMGRPSSLRLRGKSAAHIGRTVEGVPIAGEPGFASGNGGGDLFDMENMGAITLIRGAVPADKGLGFSNSGVVDMTLRRPENVLAVHLSQSVGTNAFRRTYARLDTGERLPVPVRFFLSASDSHVDKWRGPGEQKRQNVEAGLTLDISPRVQADIFAVHHDVSGDAYRPLSYTQMHSDADYASLDYNPALTGNAQADAMYYGFNRSRYVNNAILGTLTIQTFDGAKLLFKPHYWKENGWSLAGNANNGQVRYWEVAHDTWGFDLRHEIERPWGGWTLGYWHYDSEAPPPPTAWRQYQIQTDGSLKFLEWSTLAEASSHRFNNPYATLTWRTDTLRLNAGVRYMRYKDAAFTYYQGDTAPDVNYEHVFGYHPVPDPDMFSLGHVFHAWLPHAALFWAANPALTLTANYGRTYGRPNWAVSGAYAANRATFQAAGISFDDLWNRLRPEQSDTLDMGFRWEFASGWISTTLFHTRYRYKQISLYDADVINPATGLGVTYHRAVGQATGKGVELEFGLTPVRNLDVYLSYSFNRAAYGEDAQTASSRVVPIKGKQMQDSPRHMAKLNLLWQPGAWSLMAGVRYLGTRFGDTEEREKVNAYTLVDLGLGVSLGKKVGLRELGAHLSVANVFDKRHIGIIGTSDYVVGGGTSYMPGPARTVSLNLSGRF